MERRSFELGCKAARPVSDGQSSSAHPSAPPSSSLAAHHFALAPTATRPALPALPTPTAPASPPAGRLAPRAPSATLSRSPQPPRTCDHAPSVPLATLLALAACAPQTRAPAPLTAAAISATRTEIAATFAHGARAWNAGDLDNFLSDYEPDSGTTYVGRRAVLHGIPQIRDVYASRFAPGAQRDSLHFEGLEVDVLAPDLANAIAWYVLMRGDSVAARGPTSLLMRKRDGRWRIVHDHSS